MKRAGLSTVRFRLVGRTEPIFCRTLAYTEAQELARFLRAHGVRLDVFVVL